MKNKEYHSFEEYLKAYYPKNREENGEMIEEFGRNLAKKIKKI